MTWAETVATNLGQRVLQRPLVAATQRVDVYLVRVGRHRNLCRSEYQFGVFSQVEAGDRRTSPVGVESVSREGCIDELVDLGHVYEGLWAVDLGMSTVEE